MAKVVNKRICSHQTHIDVLGEIISTHAEVKNYSEAARFLCMNYDPEIEKKVNSNRTKLSGINREVSILTGMVSEFANLHLKDTGILIGTSSTVYQEARERVEGKIESNQTKEYSPQLRKSVNGSVYARVDPLDPTKILKR